MTTITIRLSPSQEEFVATQVKCRGLPSASAYVSQLLRSEQLKSQRVQIDALLLEGLRGPDSPMTKQDLQELEREGQDRLAEEKKNGRKRAKKHARSKRSA